MHRNIYKRIGPLYNTIIFEQCLISENAALSKLPNLLYASRSVENIHASLYSGILPFYKL